MLQLQKRGWDKMKKVLIFFLAFTVLFAFTASDYADARRGGFSSGKRSFTTTPKKSTESNISRSDAGVNGSATKTATGTSTAQRGFFSGGSFWKGMMIGGLAGLLFGGLFANFGFLGDLLGLMVNLLALYFLFIIIRSVVKYFADRKKLNENRRV